MPNVIAIEVCQRVMDHCQVPSIIDGEFMGMVQAPKYHAQIQGRPGFWACGDSRAEAIGNLIRNCPEVFGMSITDLGTLSR